MLLLLLTACSQTPKPDDTAGGSSLDSADSASGESGVDSGDSGTPSGPLSFAPPAAVTVGHFATAGVCAQCHSNDASSQAMRDSAGREVAPYDLWGATTMASAARNPYWWAAVAAEKAAQPGLAAEIEGACMTCHAPALVAEARLTGGSVALSDLLATDDRAVVGLDGVTCTVCHQIEPDGLGEEETFSGGYPIAGTSTIYGPYADPFTHPMEMHSGYTPAEGSHIRDAGLCATCHTLTTAAVDDEGAPTGDLHHEQSPYSEWQSSEYGRAGIVCQDCHVPQVDEEGNLISTRIARHPYGGEIGSIDERSPYGRHTFTGGNVYTLRILRDNADTLRPYASTAAFEANLTASAQFLEMAARLEVGAATPVGDSVEVPVTVVNQAGHKLPTAYPSRRVWLRVVGTDTSGAVVFRSGEYDARGRLLAADGTVRAEEEAGGPVFGHADRVDEGGVAVWQVVMQDASGVPTHRLLSAATYLVDDRILPSGWDTAGAEAAGVAPVGVDGDADFVAGSDTVHFVLPASVATIEVELLYQSASPRHLAEIFAWDDPTIAAFEAMAAVADPGPERIVATKVTLAR